MQFAGTSRSIKPRLGPLLATLVLLSVGACGGDDPVGVEATASDLLGTWDITSLTFTSVPAGSSAELVSQGFSGEITFRQDGTYTLTTTDPGQAVEVEDGTFTVSGSTLSLIVPGEVSALTIQALTSTAATLFQADDEYDFNDDGTETPATVTVVLAKQ